MKALHKLTEEELTNLVSYQISNVTLYYSDISNILTDSIIYKGKTVDAISSIHIDAIRKGKLKYEAYRLQQSSINIEDYVKTQAKEVLTEEYGYHFTKLNKTLTTIQESNQALINTYDNLIADTNSMANKVDSLTTSINTTDIEQIQSALSSARSEFELITGKLRLLFEE